MKRMILVLVLCAFISPMHKLSASAVLPMDDAGTTAKFNAEIFVGNTRTATSVDKVTVYRDRALVQRTGKISVPQGESKIVIKYLPQNIDKNSVRVSVSGSAKATLSGVEVFFEKYTPKLVQQLKDSIQAIDDRLAELKIEEDGIATQQRFLQSVASLGGANAQDKHLVISPQNLSTTADFLKKQLAGLAKAQTEISSERRVLKKRRAELQEQLSHITGGRAGRGYRVEVPLTAKTAAQFTITLKYIAYNASWMPQYDARYDEKSGKVSISYFGKITQSTGEDWKNSKIILSTAQPQLGTKPPELSQWLLRKYQPIRKYERPKKTAVPLSPTTGTAQLAEMALEADYETATPSISGETVIFEVPSRRTIPADGQDHRVVIAQFQFDAQKNFVAIPKLVQKVYLTAKCKNESEYLLLPGKVSVFQGNNFVGTQNFKQPIAFGEEFLLAMGSVQTIEVERKRTKEFAERTGIIGQNKREFFAYSIIVSNNSKSRVDVVVIDQIPVSTDEDIRVEDVKFEPMPDERDKRYEGEVRWKISLNPGEKKELQMQFAVKYPKDVVVQGL